MSVLQRLLNRIPKWEHGSNTPEPKVWQYTIKGRDGSPYLTRAMLPRFLGVRIMLHHFHRPDEDDCMHNHPWEWALALVLKGSYVETRMPPLEATRTRVVRFFNFITQHDYHKIDSLKGDVWTLFITGPRLQDWGFLTPQGHVPWKEFLKRRDKASREGWGCRFDTDGDGNCHVHPNGCP